MSTPPDIGPSPSLLIVAAVSFEAAAVWLAIGLATVVTALRSGDLDTAFHVCDVVVPFSTAFTLAGCLVLMTPSPRVMRVLDTKSRCDVVIATSLTVDMIVACAAGGVMPGWLVGLTSVGLGVGMPCAAAERLITAWSVRTHTTRGA